MKGRDYFFLLALAVFSECCNLSPQSLSPGSGAPTPALICLATQKDGLLEESFSVWQVLLMMRGL